MYMYIYFIRLTGDLRQNGNNWRGKGLRMVQNWSNKHPISETVSMI